MYSEFAYFYGNQRGRLDEPKVINMHVCGKKGQNTTIEPGISHNSLEPKIIDFLVEPDIYQKGGRQPKWTRMTYSLEGNCLLKFTPK